MSYLVRGCCGDDPVVRFGRTNPVSRLYPDCDRVTDKTQNKPRLLHGRYYCICQSPREKIEFFTGDLLGKDQIFVEAAVVVGQPIVVPLLAKCQLRGVFLWRRKSKFKEEYKEKSHLEESSTRNNKRERERHRERERQSECAKDAIHMSRSCPGRRKRVARRAHRHNLIIIWSKFFFFSGDLLECAANFNNTGRLP